jgi:hypothetical protein
MLSNGQIWSLSHKISSIDSHVKVLPAPLPDWFASLDWGIVRLIMLFIWIPIQVFIPYLLSRRVKS